MAETTPVVEKKDTTLNKSLKTDLPSMPVIGQTQEGQKFGKTMMAYQKEANLAQADLEKAQSELEIGKLGAQADVSKQYADTQRQIYTTNEEKLKEFPRPEFHPTKENAESLGQLFSMVATMGVMLGNGGKMASQNALGAMTGMLKGWQQGRKDLYERELKEFDKEYKRISDVRTDIQNDLQKSLQLASTDKESSLLYAQMAAAKAGYSSVIGAKLRVNDTVGALETLKQVTTLDQQVIQRQQQAAQAAASLAMQQKRLDYEIQKDKDKAAMAGVTGALPKESKIKEQYSARYQTIKNIEDIQSLLQDPKYAKFINPTTKFTPDVLLNLQKNFPELQSKLARIQAIEFETGGKSLTVNESKILEPIYGWRGITADALKQRLDNIKKNLQNTQGLEEAMYPGFAQLRPQFDKVYEQSGRVPVVPNDVGGGQQQAPQSAVEYLKNHPEFKEQFKAKYGYLPEGM
jgi:hypothetical protein